MGRQQVCLCTLTAVPLVTLHDGPPTSYALEELRRLRACLWPALRKPRRSGRSATRNQQDSYLAIERNLSLCSRDDGKPPGQHPPGCRSQRVRQLIDPFNILSPSWPSLRIYKRAATSLLHGSDEVRQFAGRPCPAILLRPLHIQHSHADWPPTLVRRATPCSHSRGPADLEDLQGREQKGRQLALQQLLAAPDAATGVLRRRNVGLHRRHRTSGRASQPAQDPAH